MPILLSLLLAALVCPPARAQTASDAVRDELLRMRAADQDSRHALISKGLGDAEAAKKMSEVDAANTKRLKEIVRSGGWPKRSVVGDEAARAAWLLVQHADAEPLFQESCLRLMERLLPAKEVFAADVAYLTDRVRAAQGRPQVYGTQVVERGCTYEPRPIEDAGRVDERRAAAGLDTLAENLKRLFETYGAPSGCPKAAR
jgi:hypothetical protein